MNPSVNFFLFCTFNRRHSGLRDYSHKLQDPNQTPQLAKIPCANSSNCRAVAHLIYADKATWVGQAASSFLFIYTGLSTVLSAVLGTALHQHGTDLTNSSSRVQAFWTYAYAVHYATTPEYAERVV